MKHSLAILMVFGLAVGTASAQEQQSQQAAGQGGDTLLSSVVEGWLAGHENASGWQKYLFDATNNRAGGTLGHIEKETLRLWRKSWKRLTKDATSAFKKGWVQWAGPLVKLADVGIKVAYGIKEGGFSEGVTAYIDEVCEGGAASVGSSGLGALGTMYGFAVGGPAGAMVGGLVGSVGGAALATWGYNALLSDGVKNYIRPPIKNTVDNLVHLDRITPGGVFDFIDRRKREQVERENQPPAPNPEVERAIREYLSKTKRSQEDWDTLALLLTRAEQRKLEVLSTKTDWPPMFIGEPPSHPDDPIHIIPIAKDSLNYVFNARLKATPFGDDIVYQWSFEDPAVQWKNKRTKDPSVSYTFPAPGTYTVRLSLVKVAPNVEVPIGNASVTVDVLGPTTPTAVTHSGDYTLEVGIWDPKDDNHWISLSVHPESGTFETDSNYGTYYKKVDLGPCQKPFGGNVEYSVTISFEPVQGRINLKTGQFSGISKTTVQSEIFQGAVRSMYGGEVYVIDKQGRFIRMIPGRDSRMQPGMSVYPAGIAGAYKALGFNPHNADVTGRLSGKIDLQRGGGTAKFVPQHLEEKAWSAGPNGFVGVRFEFPQGPIPMQMRARYGMQRIMFRLYPTVDDAKKALAAFPNQATIGDETRYNHQRFQTRLGRLIVEAHVAGRRLTEETIRQQMDYTLKTVRDSALYPQLQAGK